MWLCTYNHKKKIKKTSSSIIKKIKMADDQRLILYFSIKYNLNFCCYSSHNQMKSYKNTSNKYQMTCLSFKIIHIGNSSHITYQLKNFTMKLFSIYSTPWCYKKNLQSACSINGAKKKKLTLSSLGTTIFFYQTGLNNF